MFEKHAIVILLLWVISFTQGSFAQSDSGVICVTSNIEGANVYCDSLFIGITPLSNVVVSPGRHAIIVIDGTPFQWNALRKEREIDITGKTPVVVNIEFPPDSVVHRLPGEFVQHDIFVTPKKVEFHPLLVAGGGIAVVSGITTAYFKIQADTRYDKYLATGDRELLQETRRYDTMAAVTLALSQIGLAIVAYCLLSE
jgi:hypothetical protein